MTEVGSIFLTVNGRDVGLESLLKRLQTQAVTTDATMTRAAGAFSGALKSSLLSVVGPAALVTGGLGAAVAAAKSFEDAFNLKATLDASTAAINAQLRGVRDTQQVWAEATAFAKRYNLTQVETANILRSSIDTMRASTSSVTELETALLRLQSRDVSKPISEAARALRELQAGDVTTIKELFNVPAAQALKMKNEIAGGADGVKVLTAFLDRAGNGMEALEARTQGAVGAMNRLKQAEEDVAIAEAKLAQGPGLTALTVKAQFLTGLSRILTGDLSTGFAGAKNTLAGAIEQSEVYRETLARTGSQVSAFIAAWNAMQAAGGPVAATTAQVTAATATLIPTIQQVTAAMSDDAVMLQQVGVQTDAAALAAQQHTNALAVQTQQSLEAGLRTRELSDFQATLARLGGAVASGLITSANAAAVLQRQYSLTSGEAARLIGLQAQLGQVSGVVASVGGSAAGAAAAADAAALKAHNDQILAVGTHIQKVQLLRTEYERLAKQYGATSAQAINAQTKLLQEQDRVAKGAKAGGAARISDQRQLNNTLLADQQRADDQREAAARAHDQRLLDIDRRFQKASIEQQKSNELSKRSSEIDFLKSITTSELNATKEGRAAIQQINERFYADFAAAQKAAQEGNAKQSEEMVAQAKHRADVELQYAQAIDEARKKKNAGEVTRLEAIRERERQLLDEQSKQIQEGGDPNVKARQEALDEEERSFQEQQGKIKTASDDATQRKIDNALREGKNVEALNLQYQQQEEILKRIGARQGAPGSSTGTAPAASTPTPAPAATAPTGTVDLAAVVGAIDALQPLLNAVKKAIDKDTQETTRAIRIAGSTRVVQ